MGRPRNFENKNRIALEAFKLFLQKGYNNTSYRDIATASDNKITLVQHYFPSKEMLIQEFLDKVLTLIEQFIIERALKSEDAFINLYLIGQIHFAFLLTDEEMKVLALDILSSRAITSKMLAFDEDWTFNYLKIESNRKEELAQNTVMAVGGAYELGYKCLLKGTCMDVPSLMKKVMVIFMSGLGYEYSYSSKYLNRSALDEHVFGDANAYLKNRLLTPAHL